MNLLKLFHTQKLLDEHIMNEHPELRDQDNLDWKLLALQVELGECANEWRGFKKWSKNQFPRIKALRNPAVMMEEDAIYYNPMLEEYVDCLHFVLSIGLELGFDNVISVEIYESDNLINHFNQTIWTVTEIDKAISPTEFDYYYMLGHFIGLGYMLGFTWDEVEQAYYAKNKINHQRQESGY